MLHSYMLRVHDDDSYRSRILMRHPSLNLSPSPQFTEECTKICVESARQILYLTDQRRQGSHNLDTTWYGATVQLMAAVTILYSVWVKGKDATPEEVDQMKKDMELCQSIMADLDKLLGLLHIKDCKNITLIQV